MLRFLIMFFVSYVVKCDDSSRYSLIGAPEYENSPRDTPFLVYWNVPTIQCKAKNIPFHHLHEKYGIIQNRGDSFRGEIISLLYDPGAFPALLKKEDGEFKYRNGGVPQEGDLDVHLNAFRKELDRSIPDRNFNGLGVIDFESWRPVFRQNNGVLVPYREVSLEIEKSRHSWWPKERLLNEARERYEAAGREFMEATLVMAKKLRPRAVWGYYGFPYCFNMVPSHMEESCANGIEEENDNIGWLWSKSVGLYPSVYTKRIRPKKQAELIRGRITEANRVKAPGTIVVPYFWFKYLDGGFLSEHDMNMSLKTLYDANVDGIIIWGSSADVNTADKCLELQDYLEQILGPAIARYTKFRRLDEENGDDPYISGV
nr:venom polypeptide precursor [Doratifera vulnerans]